MPRLFSAFSASMRKVAPAPTLLLLLAAFVSPPTLPAQAPTDLKVEYTGKLFGYYRIEAVETKPDGSPLPRLGAVTSFLNRKSASSPLLLGMGDNFAPEFGASIQQEFRQANQANPCAAPFPTTPKDTRDSKQWRFSAPEVLYKSDRRMPALADCDNVTRFLMTAGYRAIVPGREDFIYSGTWLRRIALLLKNASSDAKPVNSILRSKGAWKFGDIHSADQKLHILAANLRVKTRKDTCPLLFVDDLASRDHPCLGTDPTVTVEMDWLRRLDQTIHSQGVEVSLSRQADQNAAFRRQTLINQVQIVSALRNGYACSKDSKALTEDLETVSNSDSYVIPTGENSLSLTGAGAQAATRLRGTVGAITCTAIPGSADPTPTFRNLTTGVLDSIDAAQSTAAAHPPVLLPRPLREDAVRLLLDLIYNEQRNIGFTIARLDSGRKVLIIGAVGKETMQEITPGNFQVSPAWQDCSSPQSAAMGPAKGSLKAADPVCDWKNHVNPKNEPQEDQLGQPFELAVGDPRFAVTTVLRAAWTARAQLNAAHPGAPPLFDAVIVMAQMPSAEAEELATRVRMDIGSLYHDDKGALLADRPMIDLILSEAQDGHESPKLDINFLRGDGTPVLTPVAGSTRLRQDDPPPISTVTISEQPEPGNPLHTRLAIKNSLEPANPEIDASAQDTGCQTAACLLKDELNVPELNTLWDECSYGSGTAKPTSDSSCQNAVLMQYLLHQLQRSSGADVVLLKRRDFFFGRLEDGYIDYDVCKSWSHDHFPAGASGSDFYTAYCRLRVALDRVLWKGDYSERVMVDGATLGKLMTTAQQQTDQEQTLLARDLHQEWLMTFGIVAKPPSNLSVASAGPETFSVPGSDSCGNGEASSPYCINGQPIVPDRAYWITTSNQLAKDNTTYTDLGALTAKSSNYVSVPKGLFLTSEIADDIFRREQPRNHVAGTAFRNEPELDNIEVFHQNRSLLQLDFSKLVAGYSLTSPSLSDTTIGSDFAGVSNTQASTPHSQELDLEAASRLTSAPIYRWFVLGAQSDAEYDRKVTGNLSGNPATVTYSPNSYSVGGLTQLAIHTRLIPGLAPVGINKSTRNLPRAFAVFAPYQYQRQMTGAFLNFPFFTPPNTTSSQQQLTIHIPTAMGFSQRAGLRYESAGIFKWAADAGSYIEIGPEYAEQNNVLAAIKLPQLSATANCPVLATQSIQACVKNAYKAAGVSLNGASVLVSVTQTLHTGGFYWDTHLQKVLDKKKSYSASFDTKGDSFLLPGATLTTQTRYAFTTKLALNFKIAGNLSLSPTYSGFFFENQGISSQRTGLVASSFSIAAKWYFARDAQVPFRKQLGFTGPGSVDQTSSAKIK